MKRRVLTLGLLALAFLAFSGSAQAHIVPQGVGSQTWFEFRPSGIRLSYNMGFSSLLGYEYLTKMDTDHNGRIDAVEKRLWLDDFGEKMLKNLELFVDGERVPFRVVESSGTGMIGDVSNVAFDTLFTFESDFRLGTKAHKISYYEGNFPNEKAQQYLWLPADYSVYKTFYHTQKLPISAPLRDRGYIRREGRDVSIDLQFNATAVVEDEALQKVLIHTKALERILDGFESTVVTESLNEGVNAWAFEETVFGRPKKAMTVPGPSAELAKARVPGAPEIKTGSDSLREQFDAINQGERSSAPIADTEETDEIIEALKLINEPFSWAAILTFLILGAWHARGPGHGKTMVAAYLIGRKGTIGDAIKLGLMVTFTHTISLYTIGLAAVYVVQRLYETEEYSSNAFLQNVTFWVTFLSGVAMIFFGITLFRQRYRNFKSGRILPEGVGAHDHSHGHSHGHHHPHSHDHGHSHSHDHSHGKDGEHSHSHDHGEGHSHDHGEGHSHDHGEGHSHDHEVKEGNQAQAHSHAHDHDHSHSHGEGHSHDHSHSHGEGHSHDHSHSHGEGHAHDHDHSHDHGHAHSHSHGEGHSHSHGHGHSHSHGGMLIHDHAGLDPVEHAKAHAEEFTDVSTFKDLMAVAISGGLVPCPMGVIIIIYSLRPEHKDRLMQCLTYLISFSLGLGIVITAIALFMVLFRDIMARALQDKRKRAFITFAPLVSALLICGIGFVLSYESFDPGFTETRKYVFGEAEKRPVLKDGQDGGAGKRDNEVKKG